VAFDGKDGAEVKARFLEVLDRVGKISVAADELGIGQARGRSWAREAGFEPVRGRRRHPRRGEYEQLRVQGVPQRRAAEQVGVNQRTARDWDQGVKKSKNARTYPGGLCVDYAAGTATIGGVTSPAPGLAALEKQLHPRFLTLAERERIRDLRAEGRSLRAIGRALGRPASTILREIRASSAGDGEYRPYAAHRTAASRRPRPKDRKLLAGGPLRQFVEDGLRRRWSPEQICHALRKEHPGDQSMRVSVETVYQALYLQARGGLKREVQAALRTGRARRKPRRDPGQRTQRFTGPMVMISDRGAEAEDRAVPGHWEGDLIIGEGGRSAIGTLVERATRCTLLVHLSGGHDAGAVRDGLVRTIETLPAHLRGSLTWDQGSEMARHRQFAMATGMPVYFCDPASPWQRGSNENTNGLLRQYFPKGTDLSAHGPEDLEHVAQELNGRPRKTLGWDTPAERLRDLLTT
jgi:transposase, IS30 family